MFSQSVKKLWKAASKLWKLVILFGVLILPLASHGFYDPPVTVAVIGRHVTKPGEAMPMEVSVMSKILLKDPKLTVKLPFVGSAPAEEVILWAGSPEVTLPHDFEYTIPALPPGRYMIETVFEFTAPDEARVPMFIGKHAVVSVNEAAKERTYQISQTIYYDVRPDKIYAGNSFEHIEKRELILEIRLKSGKGMYFNDKELWKLSVSELEKMNGGPWKDKLDSFSKTGNR